MSKFTFVSTPELDWFALYKDDELIAQNGDVEVYEWLPLIGIEHEELTYPPAKMQFDRSLATARLEDTDGFDQKVRVILDDKFLGETSKRNAIADLLAQ